MNFGSLLSDVVEQLRTSEAAPPNAMAPSWVTEQIISDAGLLVLARAGLADDIDTVLAITAQLSREGRSSTRSIAAKHGWTMPLVRRVRHALAQISGLGQLGRSWAPEPVGKVGVIPVWNGARRWLIAVSIQLQSIHGKAVIAHHKSSRPLVMRVARHDAKTADGRSGRGVRTSHETVARQLGVSRDAVRHARYVLEAIGMSVTVVQGRYLTTAERVAAHKHHGGRQRRIASTRHLTMPRGMAQALARHLPRSGSVKPSPLESSKSPRRAGDTKRRSTLPPIPLVWQKLAGQVVSVLPHLGEKHLGNLTRGLMRLPIDPNQWTGHRLVQLVELANRHRGLTQPDNARSQLGLFLHQVRIGLTVI